ncbi:unnamed protein product [Phaedon cochleariae]|uniref:Major facilitator superfamily (MFS) profile domain-containing protein n=1 Tax=Phaedon cochleariae TaxID=80249 RepID=A0A9P0GSC4_PHACE|nr:unnamed protein product [Phaedon cochleariae]
MNSNCEKFDIEQLTFDLSSSPADAEFDLLESENEENQQQASLFLYFSAMIVCMVSSVKVGLYVVWIAPLAENLLSDDPNVNPLEAPITTTQLSTIGAILTLSLVIGSLVLGKISDIFGRKKAMIVLSVPTILLEMFLAFATNIYMIYIPLILMGFCLGGTQVAGRIYLAEIGEDHHKTQLVCFGVLGTPLGNVCSFLISSFIPSYKIFNLVCSILLMISLGCLIIFLPETPVFLISKNKEKEAFRTLKMLRNKNNNGVHKELRSISHVLLRTSQMKKMDLTSMFSNRAIRTALIITLGVHLIAFTDGASVIMCFLVLIFERAGTTVPNYVSINLMSILQLFFCAIATKTSGRYGRRTLLLIFTLGNALSLFSIGVFFFLKSIGSSFITYISWWPIFGLILFYMSNALGLASISWVIASEVFPTNVISMTMSLLACFDGLVVSLMIFLFPIIMEYYGMHWNFFLYSVICLLGYAFIYFKLPETKDKSLLQIQAILER